MIRRSPSRSKLKSGRHITKRRCRFRKRRVAHERGTYFWSLCNSRCTGHTVSGRRDPCGAGCTVSSSVIWPPGEHEGQNARVRWSHSRSSCMADRTTAIARGSSGRRLCKALEQARSSLGSTPFLPGELFSGAVILAGSRRDYALDAARLKAPQDVVCERLTRYSGA